MGIRVCALRLRVEGCGLRVCALHVFTLTARACTRSSLVLLLTVAWHAHKQGEGRQACCQKHGSIRGKGTRGHW